MTRAEALQLATRRLTETGLEDSVREARLLLAAVLKISAIDLACDTATILSANEEELFQNWLSRRAAHEPLSRLQGTREFWSLSFHLNEATLDPRADSETLIEMVLAIYPDKMQPLKILDIGTGTGCLLLALLSEYTQAQGVGVDKSARALEAARANAAAHKLDTRATFIETSWCAGLTEAFDIIISNPPYIPSAVVESLDANVKEYDPRLALDGGVDGLGAYRAIIPEAYVLLNTDGTLAFEVGSEQAVDVLALLTNNGFQNASSRRDLGGHTRAVMGRK